jgi:hypothetical protein
LGIKLHVDRELFGGKEWVPFGDELAFFVNIKYTATFWA